LNLPKLQKKVNFVFIFEFFFNFETLVAFDLILGLNFATSKICFLQFRSYSNWANWAYERPYLLPFALAPLCPHLPLFNLAIMGIEPSSFWGREKN
jgi:hypothetical protein